MKLKQILLCAMLMSTTVISANAQAQQANLPTPTVEESKSFLEKNKTSKGVMVTSSGLQYNIIKNGKGDKPASTDKVNVHFSLKYVNGKVINDDYNKEVWSHHLDKATPGMQEAITMMQVGSKWVLYMPGNLAFGEEAFEGVPVGSAVLCEIELLDIVE